MIVIEHTLLPWGKLGELRRMAIGLTSASGRFVAATIFVGEFPGVPFCMRSG